METTEIPHLHGKKAVDKIREIAGGQVAFLCTHTEAFTINARPMTTVEITDDGRLRFFVGEDQDAVDQVQARNQVDLLYQNSSSYLSIRGHARIYRDQETINRLYNPVMNAWFDGKEDPSLHILEVSVDEAHYWSNKNGKITTLYKLAQAALTGDDVEIGVSGDLHV